MSLVNCPECHKEVSDSADSCPHCGFVNPGMKITCSGCGADISERPAYCPKCGKHFTYKTTQDNKDYIPPKRKKSSLFWIVVSVCFLLFVLKVSGAFKGAKHTKTSQKEQTVSVSEKKLTPEEEFKNKAPYLYTEMGAALSKANYKDVREKLDLFVRDNKCTYLDSIEVLSLVADFEKANKEIIQSNYSDLSKVDSLFKKAIVSAEKKFRARVKKLPASDLRGNMKGYRFLLYLNPDNKKYAEKFDYYSEKLNSEKSNPIVRKREPRQAFVNVKSKGEVVSNSAWDRSVRQVEQYLERHLKDPDSFEAIEWGVVQKSTSSPTRYRVWCKYRAKNSFGGYVMDTTRFLLDSKGNVLLTQKIR